MELQAVCSWNSHPVVDSISSVGESAHTTFGPCRCYSAGFSLRPYGHDTDVVDEATLGPILQGRHFEGKDDDLEGFTLHGLV